MSRASLENRVSERGYVRVRAAQIADDSQKQPASLRNTPKSVRFTRTAGRCRVTQALDTGIAIAYCLVTQLVKGLYIRHFGSWL